MLNIITALKIEAEPIIKHFNLKPTNNIYQNKYINLIITGSGKIKCAINTALLLNKFKYPSLNIGIAGSNKYDINKGFFIHKITDFETGFDYYPDFFKEQSEELITISKPNRYFALVDMEASGFFEAAYKFLNIEEIVLYKIISDTTKNPLKKELIPSLIKSHIQIIEELLDTVSTIEDNTIDKLLNEAQSKMKLTATQKIQLKQILTLYKIKNIPFPIFKELKKKEEVKEFITSLFSSLEI